MLTACSTTPTRTGNHPAVAMPQSEAAGRLLQVGNYDGAAAEYLRLSETSGVELSVHYRLRAAAAYIDGRRLDLAKQVLDRTYTQPGDSEDPFKKVLLARIYQGQGNQNLALMTLNGAQITPDTPTETRVRLHEMRANAQGALGNVYEAAYERVALDALLLKPDRRSENQRALWDDLNKLTSSALNRLRPVPPDRLTGWMELALLQRENPRDRAQFRQELEFWRQRYPHHTAEEEIIPRLLQQPIAQDALVSRPDSIALLLPFSGKYGRQAMAIRDGFTAAWNQDISNPMRPNIKVYNTQAAPLDYVYQEAVSDGSQMIVGPLEKQAVEIIASDPDLPVATLALNHLTSTRKLSSDLSRVQNPNLYQFGLLPEQEAQQIAERAWLDGHQRALVLAPATKWGQRVYDAFRGHWRSLGGEILEFQNYSNSTRDFSKPVKKLLNTNGSRQRVKHLETLLSKKLQSKLRRRMDADFIFMAAFPMQARQLQPQILYFDAGDLPVYATSHVYTISNNQKPDMDLEGVSFGDMPWLLKNSAQARKVFGGLKHNRPTQPTAYLRLYALGMDAYRIIPHLGRLRAHKYERFNGYTGVLSMVNNGQIYRKLSWAKFVKGKPRLLDNPSTER